MKQIAFIGLALMLAGQPLRGAEVHDMASGLSLISFTHQSPVTWRTVNDDVMGGISSSLMQTTAAETGLFTGELSLENNGGFASVRATPAQTDLSAWSGLELRLRGDGRTYQVRLRIDDRFDGIAYRATLPSVANQWITLRLAFEDFKPTFRGRILTDVPALDRTNVRQLTLMVADQIAGPFRLEIQHIGTYEEGKESHEKR